MCLLESKIVVGLQMFGVSFVTNLHGIHLDKKLFLFQSMI